MTDNNLRTGLWKKDGQNGPYYGGKIEIAGVEYWVNLYKNTRKESDKHPDLNLQLKPVEQRAAQPAKPTPADDFVDDDLPF